MAWRTRPRSENYSAPDGQCGVTNKVNLLRGKITFSITFSTIFFRPHFSITFYFLTAGCFSEKNFKNFFWYFRSIKYTVFSICGTCHFFHFGGWIKFVMSNHRVTSASGVFDHELPRDNLMFRWTRGSPGSNIYQMGKFTVDPSPTGGKNQRSLSGSSWWKKFNSTSTCSIWGALGKYP